jgi:hypothetical protein
MFLEILLVHIKIKKIDIKIEKLKLTSKIKCVNKCQQKLKHNGK